MSDPQDTEHLLDVIETLEDENATLRKRVAELEKRNETHPGEPVGWGNDKEGKFVGEE